MSRYHFHFVGPNGWAYDLWPSADNEVEAVLAADSLLEYRERIGIRACSPAVGQLEVPLNSA